MKDKVIVATADLNGSLYKLHSDHKALTVTGMHEKNCQHTWHRKLGYRDPEAIKLMEAKDLVIGMKISDCDLRGVCKTCLKGTMTKQPFP